MLFIITVAVTINLTVNLTCNLLSHFNVTLEKLDHQSTKQVFGFSTPIDATTVSGAPYFDENPK